MSNPSKEQQTITEYRQAVIDHETARERHEYKKLNRTLKRKLEARIAWTNEVKKMIRETRRTDA